MIDINCKAFYVNIPGEGKEKLREALVKELADTYPGLRVGSVDSNLPMIFFTNGVITSHPTGSRGFKQVPSRGPTNIERVHLNRDGFRGLRNDVNQFRSMISYYFKGNVKSETTKITSKITSMMIDMDIVAGDLSAYRLALDEVVRYPDSVLHIKIRPKVDLEPSYFVVTLTNYLKKNGVDNVFYGRRAKKENTGLEYDMWCSKQPFNLHATIKPQPNE